jgi:hypothetical protein
LNGREPIQEESMHIIRSSRRLWFFIALFTLALRCAQADPVVVLASAPTASGANYTWTYTAYASAPVQSGQVFTIYDVQDVLAGSASAPSDFSAVLEFVGPTPSNLTPVDSSSLLNAAFTYTGPTIAVAPGSVVDLGSFSFLSTLNTAAEETFAIQDSSMQVLGSVAGPSTTSGAIGQTAGGLSARVASSPVASGAYFTQSIELDNFSNYGFSGGSYVTIYDVPGYVAASLKSPANWTCAALLTGNTPTNVTVTDSSSVFNITCTYTGSAVTGGAPASFGDVTFQTASATALAGYSITSYTVGNGSPSEANRAVGTVAAAAVVTTSPVPEPNMIVLALAALAGILVVDAKRRRVAKAISL